MRDLLNHEKLTCFVEESSDYVGCPKCAMASEVNSTDYWYNCNRCTGLTLKVTSEGGQADA